MILEGIKKEEYREIKNYFTKNRVEENQITITKRDLGKHYIDPNSF